MPLWHSDYKWQDKDYTPPSLAVTLMMTDGVSTLFPRLGVRRRRAFGEVDCSRPPHRRCPSVLRVSFGAEGKRKHAQLDTDNLVGSVTRLCSPRRRRRSSEGRKCGKLDRHVSVTLTHARHLSLE